MSHLYGSGTANTLLHNNSCPTRCTHSTAQGLAKEKKKAPLVEIKEKLAGVIENKDEYESVYSTLDDLIAKAK